MPASAHDIAAEIRRRIPGVGVKKLHKLLYYCQGHHLATFDVPLFTDPIAAWDMGPVVRTLWRDEHHGYPLAPRSELGEAELNTIGYVVSRYGKLTGNDLETLTHGEQPWQIANAHRLPTASVDIHNNWIRDFFTSRGAPGAGDDEAPFDSTSIGQLIAEAIEHRNDTRTPDDVEQLVARLVRG